MSQNVTLPTSGIGDVNPVIAAEDINGVKYQIVKIAVGEPGSADTITGKDQDGNITALNTSDRIMRRYAEQMILEAYENSIRSLFLADSETSHRMGYEVR